MAIDLTYGDDADQPEIDRAILMTLGRKKGYVINVTTASGSEDVVVIAAPSGETLYAARYLGSCGDGDPISGTPFALDAADIHAIKIY